MLLHPPPDRHCGPPLKGISHRNAGGIRPAPGRRAPLLIGVAMPVYNQDRSRASAGGLFAPLYVYAATVHFVERGWPSGFEKTTTKPSPIPIPVTIPLKPATPLGPPDDPPAPAPTQAVYQYMHMLTCLCDNVAFRQSFAESKDGTQVC